MQLTIDLPIDPSLPADFFDCHHDKRSEEQLDAWWDKPFAVTEAGRLVVYCLDGQVQSMPTCYGSATSAAGAKELASANLTEWLAKRRKPVVTRFPEDGMYGVMRMAERPWSDSEVLEEFPDEESAKQYLDKLS
jgi:hypothetical protein